MTEAMTQAPTQTESPALELSDIAIRFGGVQAVDNVSLSVLAGEFVGLIGPNGAGKTTLIRIIAGILQPDQGQVKLSGFDVTHERTATRVRRGLALTHQIVKPFRQMSALENVVLAAGHYCDRQSATRLVPCRPPRRKRTRRRHTRQGRACRNRE